jgi:cytochrome b subunit of formate dehydrogenase
MKKDEKDYEETNLKVWVWMAVIDIVAIVITGLLILSRHQQCNPFATLPEGSLGPTLKFE